MPFHSDNAEQLEPYRPSNGTEGDIFMAEHCDQCIHDDPENEVHCQILTRALAFDVEDEQYPSDTWLYFNGGPTCLAFREGGGRGDEGPDEPYVSDPDQLDLFLELPVLA